METVLMNENNPLLPIVRYTSDLEKNIAYLNGEVNQLNVTIGQIKEELTPDWQKKANDIMYSGFHYLALKVPYVFGAEYDNDKAFDCSSFMQQIYGENGIKLPRISRNQADEGTEVVLGQEREGDLIFFDTNHDGTINHVGMVIGKGLMLHTAVPSVDITITDYNKSYGKSIVTVRRVIGE